MASCLATQQALRSSPAKFIIALMARYRVIPPWPATSETMARHPDRHDDRYQPVQRNIVRGRPSAAFLGGYNLYGAAALVTRLQAQPSSPFAPRFHTSLAATSYRFHLIAQDTCCET